VSATMVSGTSLNEENERMVRISDSGWGVPRDDVNKVWSYFYSTKQARDRSSVGDSPHHGAAEEGTARLPGGLGLGVSRVLTRYFGGEIYFHSIQRKGTDVYIYI